MIHPVPVILALNKLGLIHPTPQVDHELERAGVRMVARARHHAKANEHLVRVVLGLVPYFRLESADMRLGKPTGAVRLRSMRGDVFWVGQSEHDFVVKRLHRLGDVVVRISGEQKIAA
jgi:hypothetical protein